MSRIRLPVLLSVVLAACSDDPERNQTVGELGNGRFTYVCIDDSDPMCPSGQTASAFPTIVGVGGVFDLEFKEEERPNAARLWVVPAAPGIIEQTSELFRGQRPGIVAMLAKRTNDGRVLDFIHMSVAEVASLRLEANGSAPRLVWQTGVSQTLRAVPLSAERRALAGAREFVWTTSDPRVVRLERANPTGVMILFPLARGVATIGVTSASIFEEIVVSVEGAPLPPPSDAGAEGGEPDATRLRDAATADAADGAPAGEASVEAGADSAPMPDAAPSDGSAGDVVVADGADGRGAER